jgi:hypothetical protein
MQKHKISWLVLISMMLMVQAGAQQKRGLMVALNSDFLAVPLTGKSAVVRSSGVDLGYTLTPAFSIEAGWDSRTLLDEVQAGFEQKNGIKLGVGYRMRNDPSHFTSLQLCSSVVKGLENASDFAANLGLRWFIADSFFIGTGIRYDQWKTNPFRVGNEQSLNWYWQLGFRYTIGHKKE